MIGLLTGLAFAGWTVWNQYSTSIINLQKEQMLNTVDSVANNLEHELTNYKEDLDRLYAISMYTLNKGEDSDCKYIFEQYLENKSESVKILNLWDGSGNKLAGEGDFVFVEEYDQCVMENQVTFTTKKDSLGELYFVFDKWDEDGTVMELAVSVRDYYEELLSEIQIGANGYLVVKSSSGIIYMHPEEEQWGD